MQIFKPDAAVLHSDRLKEALSEMGKQRPGVEQAFPEPVLRKTVFEIIGRLFPCPAVEEDIEECYHPDEAAGEVYSEGFEHDFEQSHSESVSASVAEIFPCFAHARALRRKHCTARAVKYTMHEVMTAKTGASIRLPSSHSAILETPCSKSVCMVNSVRNLPCRR